MRQQGYALVIASIILLCSVHSATSAAQYKYVSTDSLLVQIKKHYRSSPALAIDYAIALQKEAKAQKNKALEAKALWSIAYINYENGNLNESVEAYFKAIPLYKGLNDKKYVGKAYYNIGKILTDTKNDKAAEGFYLKALNIYTGLNETKWITKTNILLAKTYIGIKSYRKAQQHLNIALNLAKEHKYKGSAIKVYNLLGFIEAQNMRYSKAIAFYNKSLAITGKDNKIAKAVILYNLSEANYKLGNNVVAKDYSIRSLSKSKSINNLDRQVKPQIILANIAKKEKGNNKQEYKNLLSIIRKYATDNYNVYLQEALYYVSNHPNKELLGVDGSVEMMGILTAQSELSTSLYEKTKMLLNQHSIQLSIEKVQHEQKVGALKEKNDVLKWGSVVGLMVLLFILIGYAQYVKHKKQLQQAALNLAETQLKETENRIESVLHENRKIKLSKESIYNELNEHVAKNVMLAERSKTLTAQIENYGDEYEKLNNRLTSSKNMMHEMSAYVWNMIKEVSRQGLKIPPPPPWDMGGERDN